jgi:quercetin dioxygenase-like cupin family protein
VWLSENEVLEFKLEPGDLIFIPVGLYHQVKSVTSRAGITWSANIA